MITKAKAKMTAALFLLAAINPAAGSSAENVRLGAQTTSASLDRLESRFRIAQQGRINPDNIAGARSLDETPRDREREHETVPTERSTNPGSGGEPRQDEPPRPGQQNR